MPTIAEVRAQYPQYKDMSDDALASALHSKFYADMPRADFDMKIGLDPAKVEAKTKYDMLKSKGVPVEAGYARRAAQGMTFGAAEEILAGLTTPLEMIDRKTWDPREGYRHAKAYQDVVLDEAKKDQGVLGHIVEAGGGVGSGLGLARGGMTLMRPGMGLVGRTGALATEGAGYGSVTGFMDGGNSLEDRMSNAGKGAAIGAGVGAALPLGAAAVGTVAAPVVSNIRARVNPQGVAVSQVARGIEESGRPVADIVDDVTRAANEGQGVFTVADAMGNSGQRMLSGVTRSPGPGRTQAVEFLEQRQAGQGRRIANALSEGFDSPQTAAQTSDRLTASRDAASDAAYSAARNNAAPVDLSRAIANLDATLRPGATQVARPQSGIANDSAEAALESFRNRLTDGRSILTDYAAVERVRGDLADAIQAARQAGHGNRARLLGGLLREIDFAMEAASSGFRAANQQHAANSRVIDAVGEGRNASMRGRTENTLPAFHAMPPQQQAAYRAGYVDPLIEQTQGAAFGVNKARPLTSDAFRDEAAAIAPGNDLMSRRIGRENTMFETRNHALGGSRTADNLADADALKVDPSIVAAFLSGNIGGAARQTFAHASNALHGSTPAVRENIARLLLQSQGAPNLQGEITRHIDRVTQQRLVAAMLARGFVGGTAVSGQQARGQQVRR